ncbi:uncharacterized protein C2845_PM04G16510 [Panicum miliaceum]|uniref:Knr4/Smi1-like domain-containing protein n=1 Tax=Panicum miliaceum TaxID=4540 RepID=A0A3L6QQ29_PANMI|nr:uncharacterized protein C2845_PM04G16510 [Panicum miliaceum]
MLRRVLGDKSLWSEDGGAVELIHTLLHSSMPAAGERSSGGGGGWLVCRGGGNGGRGPADGQPDPAAHAPGLRRLSTRAAAGSSSPSASPRHGLHSFAPLAAAVLAHLRAFGVAVLPGLTELELARAEAELGFAFPPDLRAVLAAGSPQGPGSRTTARRCSCPLFDRCFQPGLLLPVAGPACAAAVVGGAARRGRRDSSSSEASTASSLSSGCASAG